MPENFFESRHCGKPGVGTRAHCRSCRKSAPFRHTLAKSFGIENKDFECPWGANENGEFAPAAEPKTPAIHTDNPAVERSRTPAYIETGVDWIDERARWLDAHDNAWQRSQHPLEGGKFLEWLKARNPKSLLEIGNRTASNSYMLAGAMVPGAVVEGVDPSRAFVGQRRAVSIKLREEGSDFVPYRDSSENLLKLNTRHTFYDCIYIDGDHSYKAALRDWKLSTMKLQPYGCLGYHDTSNMLRDYDNRCSKFFQDIKQFLPETAQEWHTDERMRGMGVGATAFNGRLLFIVNGGLGDAVELTRTMLVASRLGYLVHVLATGSGAPGMNSIWELIPWINAVDRATAEKYEYEAVLCSTSMKALKERAQGLKYKKLLNGKPDARASMIRNNQKLLEELGHDRKDMDRLVEDLTLGYLKPANTSAEAIVVAPGIGSQKARMERGELPDKRYHRWKEAISYMPKPVRVVGTESAREPWLKEVANDRDVFDLVGTTKSVADLLPILWKAHAVICSDNGIGHLARLLGVTTISVFNNTSPKCFAPPGAVVLEDTEVSPMLPGELTNQLHYLHNPECMEPVKKISDWKLATMKLSVIISTHNEGDEVLMTIRDVYERAGCPVEIIIIDEASNDGSCDNLPEYVRIIRNEERRGVAPARNQGAAIATGDAMMFLDAHMRVLPGIPAKMMEAALEKDALIVPGVAPLYSPGRGATWVCRWIFKGGRLRSNWHSSCKDEFVPTDCFVAPGWVVSRKNWDKMGPWAASLSHWGSTEVYKSLQATFAGVPMLAMREAVTWHRFRGRFPYSVKTTGIFKNAYVAAKIIFGEEVFNKVFLPAMQQHHWGAHIEEALMSDTMLADMADFEKRRVADPWEFIRKHFPDGLDPSKESFFETDECRERKICEKCRLDPSVQKQIMVQYDTKSSGDTFECPHGVTAAQFSNMDYPSAGKQVVSLITAAARAAKSAVSGKGVLVDDAEYTRRLEICLGCEVYDAARQRCRKCGCYTRKKIWLLTEHCPTHRW